MRSFPWTPQAKRRSSGNGASGGPCNDAPYRLINEATFGEDVFVHSFTNLYGCHVGDRTRIGPFVEVQRGATIGSDCKIQSHAFVCDGVTIGDEAFVGHGVIFINDNLPRATNDDGRLRAPSDWELRRTTVGRGASLGSGAVVLGGLRIGDEAVVGAGAVVTRDVPPGATVAGNPARVLKAGDEPGVEHLVGDSR
ncbi:MAG TPA: acyltransferase [Solirubrobacterales bacterium]|jgi:acetyltransferase-like isoleucine patch superfamily enzyme